jgi:hypothetical protein
MNLSATVAFAIVSKAVLDKTMVVPLIDGKEGAEPK